MMSKVAGVLGLMAIVASADEQEEFIYKQPWQLYGCSSLSDIPCDMKRPFCDKVYMGDQIFHSVWVDGKVTYDSCVQHYWRGRRCRAYKYQYGVVHPDDSTVPDLQNLDCFSDFSNDFSSFGFDETSQLQTKRERTYSNTYYNNSISP